MERFPPPDPVLPTVENARGVLADSRLHLEAHSGPYSRKDHLEDEVVFNAVYGILVRRPVGKYYFPKRGGPLGIELGVFDFAPHTQPNNLDFERQVAKVFIEAAAPPDKPIGARRAKRWQKRIEEILLSDGPYSSAPYDLVCEYFERAHGRDFDDEPE